MNITKARFGSLIAASAMLLVGLTNQPVHAFPPAPHHTIFGTVRNELGHPLPGANAKIIFDTANGLQIKSNVGETGDPGVNYELIIPMDSGLSGDAYKPHAQTVAATFRIRVQIGTNTYVPIEMAGDVASLGAPGGSTRINLTLGVDSDGDGLPDAWERWLIAMLRNGSTLASIGPNSDSDRDNQSDYAEYISGTYAFDPGDGFTLKISGMGEHGPLLDLHTIRDRTYTLYETADFVTWTPVDFRLSDTPAGQTLSNFRATSAQQMRVHVTSPTSHRVRFFKAHVD
jgi:hypothetical protein